MLKNCLAFAILAHCVICRFAPKDRQWAEGDLRQNCTERCHDECEECPEAPKRCTEKENKCGEEPPIGHPDCIPNDICVPSNCLCMLDVI